MTDPDRRRTTRVLVYSHDSFGLGHLRRCRTIAHALVDQNPDVSVLILSGSPIIGSFDFRPRVDFVRVPGVIKLNDGQYTSLTLDIDIEETLAMRASIIRHTADIFDPDLFLVDKEPLGLRGEVRETLEMLKRRGTPLVLGLRDVMDEPALLVPEWQRKNVVPALTSLYDEIWIYGLSQICDPLEGIERPASVSAKTHYTGYLKRDLPLVAPALAELPAEPFILVTPGGGGDGEALVDWILRAYEADQGVGALPSPCLIVFGPFMHADRQAAFMARAGALSKVQALSFESRFEGLMEAASGVVAMGGYNTFCEILSFDKPALIVPRESPRREQLIRASRAQTLGLCAMLVDDGIRDVAAMTAALQRLMLQPPPSRVVVPGLLDGLDNVNRLAKALIHRRPRSTARQRTLPIGLGWSAWRKARA